MAERMELTRPVFFVGFMGAGKTSVARRLARTCGVASVDMDTYIERREGKKVTADEAASRISDTSTRPLFQNLEAARARCEERLPLYEAVANVRVSTAGKSVPAIAREVQRILEKEGILCPQQR